MGALVGEAHESPVGPHAPRRRALRPARKSAGGAVRSARAAPRRPRPRCRAESGDRRPLGREARREPAGRDPTGRGRRRAPRPRTEDSASAEARSRSRSDLGDLHELERLATTPSSLDRAVPPRSQCSPSRRVTIAACERRLRLRVPASRPARDRGPRRRARPRPRLRAAPRRRSARVARGDARPRGAAAARGAGPAPSPEAGPRRDGGRRRPSTARPEADAAVADAAGLLIWASRPPTACPCCSWTRSAGCVAAAHAGWRGTAAGVAVAAAARRWSPAAPAAIDSWPPSGPASAPAATRWATSCGEAFGPKTARAFFRPGPRGRPHLDVRAANRRAARAAPGSGRSGSTTWPNARRAGRVSTTRTAVTAPGAGRMISFVGFRASDR